MAVDQNCVWNKLTKTSELADLTYVLPSATPATVTPQYSATVAAGSCPMTATLYVLNDPLNTWEDNAALASPLSFITLTSTTGALSIV